MTNKLLIEPSTIPHHHLSSWHQFSKRLFKASSIGLCLIVAALFLGMWGYHHFEHENWLNAYLNAAMLLSGEGPLTQLKTTGGKIFAGSYAIFSGLFFTVIVGLIFVPIAHRIFHKLNIEDSKNNIK